MDQNESVELRRLQLEERRLDLDESIRRAEITLRERAFASTRRGLSLPMATAVAALMGLAGVIAGACLTGYSTHPGAVGIANGQDDIAARLEQQEFEAGLILRALAARDQQTAVLALQFIARAGLIPSYERTVLNISETNGGSAVPFGLVPGFYAGLGHPPAVANVPSYPNPDTARGNRVIDLLRSPSEPRSQE